MKMERSRTMNPKVYKQADSRWGSLPYPTKAYRFASNGCGCCSVTHCAIELDKYKNYTPADVRKYMVQFATKGHGTLWNGITKGLQYYGYNVHWNQKDSMATIAKTIKASPIKRGVILFGSSLGGSQRIRWTNGGHYIAFVDFKEKDGDYLFYLKDSGGRGHTGWYSYKKHMKGDVRQVWVCTSVKGNPTPKPTPAPTRKYTGTIPKPTLKMKSTGDRVKSLQKFLNWYGAYGLKVDGRFGKLTKNAVKLFQRAHSLSQDGIYGEKTYAKAKAYK